MRKSKIYLAVVIMTIMTGVCGCNFIGKWNINNTEKEEKTEVQVHRMPTEEELQILEGCNLSSDYMKQIKEEGMSLTVQSFVDTARIMLDYLEQKYGEQFVVAGGSPADMWTSDFMIFAKATTGEHKGERFECYYKLDEDAGKRYCEDGYFALVEQPVMEQYFQQVAEESGCQFKVTVSLTGEVGEKYTTDISTDELKEYIDGRNLCLNILCFTSPELSDDEFDTQVVSFENTLKNTDYKIEYCVMRVLNEEQFNSINRDSDVSRVFPGGTRPEDEYNRRYYTTLNMK